MLVDDEELSLELLSRCIDWEEAGMEIVSKMLKPEPALEEVDRLVPDIVVSDINMPRMNGLEFGRLVLEKNPKIKFVLLTGYEEFEYAKHSVKLGVSDFLLKPISPDEIMQSMVKLKKTIEAEASREEYYNRLKKQLDENFGYLKEAYLNRALAGKLSSTELENSSFYGIDFASGCFRLCIAELSPAEYDSEESRLIKNMNALETVRAFFLGYGSIHVFPDNAGNIAIICCDGAINFEDMAEQLQESISNGSDFNITIGMGGSCENVRDLPALSRKAAEALNYKMVIGSSKVIYPEDIVYKTINRSTLTQAQKEKICFYVKAGLPDEAVNLAFDFFDSVSPDNTGLSALKVNAIELISLIFNNVWDIDTSTLSEMLPGCFHSIFGINTVPEMKEYFKECVCHISSTLESAKDREKTTQIRSILDFLKSNYADYSITLKSTADKFYKNASYLSRLFRHETGESFVEHLTRIRMEESVRLLKHSDMKTYEISEAVGILDPNYFSKCFRKYTGMSVSEYRKSIRD